MEDAESTWVKVGGGALPGQVWSELGLSICPSVPLSVSHSWSWLRGGIPALSAKPLLTQAGLSLDLQGHRR